MQDAQKEERALRIKNSRSVLQFNITFLDDALCGIYPEDLIIIGAKTGFGKTQLATQIALTNSMQGKRVHYLALEASKFEIQRRCKYQIIRQLVFDSKKYIPNFTYSRWYYGKLDDELKVFEEIFDSQPSPMNYLNVYYRDKDFNIEEFQRVFSYIKDQSDLIIIDHLHYFDFDDANENRAIKDTLKNIRDCALNANKPVILIAHVRKSDKRSKQLIPDIEDFHGSSDIGKIGTKIITIAPVPDSYRNNCRETYMQIVKSRVDGNIYGYTAKIPFKLVDQNYDKKYYIGKMNYECSEFNTLSSTHIPEWARVNAIDDAR